MSRPAGARGLKFVCCLKIQLDLQVASRRGRVDLKTYLYNNVIVKNYIERNLENQINHCKLLDI